MKATIKEQVKQIFRTYNYTEAVEMTHNERIRLSHIMRDEDIRKMVIMVSKLAGKYNVK